MSPIISFNYFLLSEALQMSEIVFTVLGEMIVTLTCCTSSKALQIPFCITTLKCPVCTYTHIHPHTRTQLLQPSKPNYSPPASMCQPVMSPTERVGEKEGGSVCWLIAWGCPCWQGQKKEWEVKRRLAIERLAK